MASIFISHSSIDKDFVRQLAEDLRALGHEPWLDEEQIAVGDSIPTKIAAGIQKCDFVAIVLSQNAVRSGWVQEEWQSKYWEQIQERRTRVLPLLKDYCEMPVFLKDKMYADFRDSYGIGLVRLIRSIDQLMRPSPLTPDTKLLNELVNTYIEALGRAISLPVTPAQLKLRVFVFRAEGKELVCRYFWAQDPVEEKVGRTRFSLDKETAQRVAVVHAALNKKICRRTVSPLPENAHGVVGDVDDDLSYVLAAPIFAPDDSVWGTVDFDTSTEEGIKLLSRNEANSAIHRFARHLELVFAGKRKP